MRTVTCPRGATADRNDDDGSRIVADISARFTVCQVPF